MLYELKTAFALDTAIMNEQRRLVFVVFGRTSDEFARECRYLEKLQVLLVNMAIFYKLDTDRVQEFNQLYELEEPCDVIVFHRNKPTQFNGRLKNRTLENILETEMIQMVKQAYIKLNKQFVLEAQKRKQHDKSKT